MCNNSKRDLLILQEINQESHSYRNKQHTFMRCAVRLLYIVLLVMLFYGAMFLFALTKTGSAW